MHNEFSAGGVVFRKNDTSTEILICQHSKHHGWVFPKGHIGDKIDNETPEEAALREVREETGIKGSILQTLSLIDYWYNFEGEKRRKVVQYYLMAYVSGDINDHDFEMEQVIWLSENEVSAKLTYPGDKKVWEEAQKKLNILN